MSAHAGSVPWMGKNALYAATCGINAVNAIRETFEEVYGYESKEKGDHMISDKDLAACCLRRGLPNYFRRWSA